MEFIFKLTPAFLGGLGFGELMIILVIIIVLFGASRLPQIGEGLGKGIKNFKNAFKGEDDSKKEISTKDPEN